MDGTGIHRLKPLLAHLSSLLHLVAILCDLFGMVKRTFQRFSDLNHLVFVDAKLHQPFNFNFHTTPDLESMMPLLKEAILASKYRKNAPTNFQIPPFFLCTWLVFVRWCRFFGPENLWEIVLQGWFLVFFCSVFFFSVFFVFVLHRHWWEDLFLRHDPKLEWQFLSKDDLLLGFMYSIFTYRFTIKISHSCRQIYQFQGSSWWLNQPIWKKKCASAWIMKPQGSRWKFQKYLSCHHLLGGSSHEIVSGYITMVSKSLK